MLGLAASKDRWMVAGKAGEQFWYVIIVRQHTGDTGWIQATASLSGVLRS